MTDQESGEPTASMPLYEPDPVLLAREDLARAALRGITADANVGALVGSVPIDDHVLSLQFECRMLAYPHWLWTVTLSRIDENSEPTVLEYELLPGEGALLSPPWVPWAERLAANALAEEESDDAGLDDDDDIDDIDDIDDDELDDDPDVLDDDDVLEGVDPEDVIDEEDDPEGVLDEDLDEDDDAEDLPDGDGDAEARG